MKAEALLKLAQRFELQPLLRLCQDSIVPWRPVQLVHGHVKSHEVTCIVLPAWQNMLAWSFEPWVV